VKNKNLIYKIYKIIVKVVKFVKICKSPPKLRGAIFIFIYATLTSELISTLSAIALFSPIV